MDLQSLFFVFVVIAIGGFSAYLADILGYKIGKKRLSIKRIRPKYVARISVVIAGMLIPIFTMLILYGVSSTFRTWITRGSEIVKDLEQKSREVDKVNGQLVEGERKNADLSNKNRIIDNELKKKQTDVDLKEAKLTSQKAEVTKLNASIFNYVQEKNKAQAELGPLKSKLLTIQKEVGEVQKSLTAANHSLVEAKNSLLDAKAKYKKASSDYSLTSSENLKLTSDNFELEKKNKAVQKASDDLQVVISNLNKDLEILKGQKSTAESETQRARSDLTVVLNELTRIRLEARAAAQDTEVAYRLKPISYLRGEELTRISIPENVSQSEAVAIYRSLLRRAKSIASDHGAKPDLDNYPFIGSAGSLLSGTGTDYLTEDEVEKYWVGQLRNLKDPAIMIAKSATNRFETEPIALEIIILPNPIVFHKGEIVTESKIDGRVSDIDILNGIRDFLRTFVNTKARSRHMIPVLARDGESYGEFTQNQLLGAVVAVKAVPRVARLVAVARQDIRAGDSLDIALEVH